MVIYKTPQSVPALLRCTSTMTTSSGAPPDPTPQTLVHLHTASQTLLPSSQALSSYLGASLLSTATENEINLPKSYVESRFCQRCGTAYVPGVTCRVRSTQSRRQKRIKSDWWWVVYECNLCEGTFRTEVEVPRRKPPARDNVQRRQRIQPQSGSIGQKEDTQVRGGKRRKKEKLNGLRDAIEKSKANKSSSTLSLLDLMKPGL
jgi:RNase P subunit RPR2